MYLQHGWRGDNHLPRLQPLILCTAVCAERPPPWLTPQRVVKCIRQSIHSFVHVILWPEVRQIQKLCVCILNGFLSCTKYLSSFHPSRWIKLTLKNVLPELSNLKSKQQIISISSKNSAFVCCSVVELIPCWSRCLDCAGQGESVGGIP